MRLPPSSLFSARTAWAVVPEPAKESRTMESLSENLFTVSFQEQGSKGEHHPFADWYSAFFRKDPSSRVPMRLLFLARRKTLLHYPSLRLAPRRCAVSNPGRTTSSSVAPNSRCTRFAWQRVIHSQCNLRQPAPFVLPRGRALVTWSNMAESPGPVGHVGSGHMNCMRQPPGCPPGHDMTLGSQTLSLPAS